MAQSSLLVNVYQVLRSTLGHAVCIYPLTCGQYTLKMLQEEPLWWSLPCIALRLLSCNPITGIIRYFLFKRALRVHEQNHPCSRNEQQPR